MRVIATKSGKFAIDGVRVVDVVIGQEFDYEIGKQLVRAEWAEMVPDENTVTAGNETNQTQQANKGGKSKGK